MQTIRVTVIKYPPKYSPQGNNLNPGLKNNLRSKASPKLTNRWFVTLMLPHYTIHNKLSELASWIRQSSNGML